MSLYFCWQGGMVCHGHTKKNSHVQPAGYGHGNDTTWKLPSKPYIPAPTTSVDTTEHCSDHLLPTWWKWPGDALYTYSSQSPVTTVVPQLTPRLVAFYFRHVADSSKPGSKVTLGFLLKQGKGGISRWGLVGWITPWKGLSHFTGSCS